jgi:hypothetical protein
MKQKALAKLQRQSNLKKLNCYNKPNFARTPNKSMITVMAKKNFRSAFLLK